MGRGEVMSTDGTPAPWGDASPVRPHDAQPWMDVCALGTYTWTGGTRSTRRTLFTRSALCKAGQRESAVSISGRGAAPAAAIPTPGGTYRRTRWALETGEASVALHASVTLFTGFTFVTTRTLGTLWEEMS